MTFASRTLASGYDQMLRLDLIPADILPPVANAMDDEFTASTLDTSKWTWVNQGSTTASTGPDRLRFGLAASGGNGIRGIYQTAPSAPWLFVAKVYVPSGPAVQTLGIFSGETNAAEIRMAGWFQGLIRGLSYTSPTAAAVGWGGTVESARSLGRQGRFYVAIGYNGSDIVGGWGSAGGLLSLAAVTPAYTPTIVGVAANSSTLASGASIGWFRRLV